MQKSRTKIVEEEIEVCDYCKGKGFQTTQHCDNQHTREWRIEKYNCQNCDGKGRMIKITTIEYKQL